MRIPKQVDILGHIYSVEIVDTIDDIDQGWDGGKCIGQIDHVNSEIRVLSMGDDASTLQALCHEIVHGYSDKLGLELTEAEIDRASSLSVEFLKRNNLLKV